MKIFGLFVSGSYIFLALLVFVLLVAYVVIPLYEQWTDRQTWNGEWPFFGHKEDLD